MVVGVGFEPTKVIDWLIYSQLPLAARAPNLKYLLDQRDAQHDSYGKAKHTYLFLLLLFPIFSFDHRSIQTIFGICLYGGRLVLLTI